MSPALRFGFEGLSKREAKLLSRIRNFSVRRFRAFCDGMLYVRAQELLTEMKSDPDFPSSAGSAKQHLQQLLIGSRLSLKLLLETSTQLGKQGPAKPIEISNFENANNLSTQLKSLLDHHGSDKGSYHGYSPLYASIFDRLGLTNLNILEIGLGTNNINMISNMGAHGKPGASLRAWRDFSKESKVFGCDIDERILFSEENIFTFHLDQTDEKSWQTFIKQLGKIKFDIIIDDGLHSPFANLQTILQAKEILKPEGFLIIEDISEQSLPIWQLLELTINQYWSCEIVKSKLAYILVLTKKQIPS